MLRSPLYVLCRALTFMAAQLTFPGSLSGFGSAADSRLPASRILPLTGSYSTKRKYANSEAFLGTRKCELRTLYHLLQQQVLFPDTGEIHPGSQALPPWRTIQLISAVKETAISGMLGIRCSKVIIFRNVCRSVYGLLSLPKIFSGRHS